DARRPQPDPREPPARGAAPERGESVPAARPARVDEPERLLPDPADISRSVPARVLERHREALEHIVGGPETMQRLSRAGAAAAVAAVALLCAGSALAANTATIAVSFTPPTLGSSTTALIHVAVPQTTDPIAAINIYTGTKIVNVAAAPNTQIGSVTATAFAHDAGLNLPLSGPVMTTTPRSTRRTPARPARTRRCGT